MRINRRDFALSATALAAAPLVSSLAWPALIAPARAATVGDNGLHTQPFFLDTFLDMGEDLSEAAAEDKGLVILFEQRGCPYCREMHEVNFTHQKVLDYIVPRFNFVQIDLWGAREVTDFDGETMEERALARRWGVNFTPTVSFFSKATQVDGSANGKMLETARLPGYFKPFHFTAMFEFIAEGHYETQGFQRYLQDKFAEMESRGEKPDVW